MRFVRSRFFRLIIVIFSLVTIFTLPGSIYTLWKRRDIVKVRQEDLSRVKQENERLKQELSQAETPEFIERVAREKLGMVKEGETLVLLPQRQSSVVSLLPRSNFGEAGQSSEDKKDLPNWKKWWRLFF